MLFPLKTRIMGLLMMSSDHHQINIAPINSAGNTENLYRFIANHKQTIPTCTNKLCPPGTDFIMCLSIFSFSRIAMPRSIKIGGGVASKLVLKSGGGFCISTVVTFRLIVFSSANRYNSIKYS